MCRNVLFVILLQKIEFDFPAEKYIVVQKTAKYKRKEQNIQSVFII